MDERIDGEAMGMSALMAASMSLCADTPLRDADGHPWSTAEAALAIAEARRDQADAAFRSALREFCDALRIPLPADWRRAQRAFAALRVNA